MSSESNPLSHPNKHAGLKSFEMTASPSGPLASAAFDLPAAQVLARLAPRLTSISLGILGRLGTKGVRRSLTEIGLVLP
jgi:hypothetical protein